MTDRFIQKTPLIILNGLTVIGYSDGVEVKDFADKILQIFVAGGSGSAVLKVLSSEQKEEPDWDAALSATNIFDYVRLLDLQSGSTYAGDTGITCSAGSAERVVINDNGSRWLCVQVTTNGSARAVTAILTLYN